MFEVWAPAATTVEVGQEVTWINEDNAPHNVVSGAFRSPILQQGHTFRWTATRPGSLIYLCTLHPNQKATLTVHGS